MPLQELTDATALVTGGRWGIGRATALALAREGANVALAARREARLEAVAEAVVSAASQSNSMVSELGFFRRDQFAGF